MAGGVGIFAAIFALIRLLFLGYCGFASRIVIFIPLISVLFSSSIALIASFSVDISINPCPLHFPSRSMATFVFSTVPIFAK